MIRFDKVTLVYPYVQRTIFEDLSFEVPEGEFVLVMGDTGSGKSTLLKLMNGLVPHHTGGIFSGTITVDGRDTALHKPRELVDVIAIVGQNPALGFVTDTVEEELVFGMESLGIPPDVMRKRVEDTLDLLALAPLRNRSLASLSGGETQRVAIASVLTMNPKILLLDEPTSALDPIAAEEVLATLSRLVHDLGITVVLAEHKLERVLQFVDRVIYVRDEREVSVGLPHEIFKDSTLAPPIIQLSRALASTDVPLTVRDARRQLGERAAQLPSPVRQRNESTQKVLLDMKNVTIKYGATLALKDACLTVRSGEVVAVMGRNGAGKSTLLSSIVGARELTRGAISLNGSDPRTLKGKSLISHVGYVPQEASDLLYAQSVEEELRHSDSDNLVTSGTTGEILATLLPEIDRSVHPRDLSEGERLCLVLAIVLANQPPLLVLDEPTRGLDYQAKARLVRAIRARSQAQSHQSSAVILASHDVELVAEIATRVIVLADGEIVADGDASEILTSSPAFAPQVAKVLAPSKWLTVNEVLAALGELR